MNKEILMIENALKSYLPSKGTLYDNLIESIDYSLQAGGKRVRPRLTLAFCRACGGTDDMALPFACAIEMIHTYSLIHDDLPCMDNDDFRRGKPSNHKVYGEDIALLAGDALQSLAFEVVTNDSIDVSADLVLRAVNILAKYCGTVGMVGGQVIDLEHEGKKADIEVIREMYSNKTSALIKAACCMGAVIAGATDDKVKAATVYAENIGIAFQIVDDILDVTSTSEELGKPIGSDAQNDKSTYVSLLGIDKCKELVEQYTGQALDALEVFDEDVSFLVDFAKELATRKN